MAIDPLTPFGDEGEGEVNWGLLEVMTGRPRPRREPRVAVPGGRTEPLSRALALRQPPPDFAAMNTDILLGMGGGGGSGGGGAGGGKAGGGGGLGPRGDLLGWGPSGDFQSSYLASLRGTTPEAMARWSPMTDSGFASWVRRTAPRAAEAERRIRDPAYQRQYVLEQYGYDLARGAFLPPAGFDPATDARYQAAARADARRRTLAGTGLSEAQLGAAENRARGSAYGGLYPAQDIFVQLAPMTPRRQPSLGEGIEARSDILGPGGS